MLLAVGFHLYLIVLRGTITVEERQRPVASAEEQKEIYKRESHSREGGERFFPHTMLKIGGMASVVFGAALLLTLTIGPRNLMPPGNLTEQSLPAEEWWFWWLSGLIALLPSKVAPWFIVLFPLLVFGGLFLLPFVDRSPFRGARQRPLWTAAVVAVIVALLGLTASSPELAIYGLAAIRTLPAIPAGIVLAPAWSTAGSYSRATAATVAMQWPVTARR